MDAIEQLIHHFDQTLIIPSALHAFRKSMATFAHRLRMTELITAECLPNTPVKVSDVERTLHQHAPDTPVYSYDLLCHLQKQYPGAILTLALGPDNAEPLTWQRFYRYQAIQAEFAIYAVKERLTLRSTHIRSRIAQTQATDLVAALAPMTGQQEAQYILEHNLYCG